MKTIYLPSILVTLFALTSVSAQTRSTTSPSFPGVSQAQMTTLRDITRTVPLVLPTWLPAGFTLETIDARLGTQVKSGEQELFVIYSRSMPAGKEQRFAIEVGFAKWLIGDRFPPTKTIQTRIGTIDLVYQPSDPNRSEQTLKDYARTKWFSVEDVSYLYIGMYGDESSNLEMISLEDTEKILASLRKFSAYTRR
jgi:hypothetical protein